jgi:hypothetical protein
MPTTMITSIVPPDSDSDQTARAFSVTSIDDSPESHERNAFDSEMETEGIKANEKALSTPLFSPRGQSSSEPSPHPYGTLRQDVYDSSDVENDASSPLHDQSSYRLWYLHSPML